MDKILIIDGMNFIHRARAGFAKGEYSIIFNFFRNLRAIVEQFNPNKCFFVLEGHPQFRYDLLPSYKANRIIKQGSKKEEENKIFHNQKREIIRLLKYLPIAVVKAVDFECDDVINTLADNLKTQDITIISNDSDFIQILQKGYKATKIYNPIKKEYVKAPEYNYLIWKCLRGDKSTDNIPGIISDDEAVKISSSNALLKKFLSSEENKSMFSLNADLIELKYVPYDKLVFNECCVDFNELKNEFEKMEFASIIADKYWNRFVNTFATLNV